MLTKLKDRVILQRPIGYPFINPLHEWQISDLDHLQSTQLRYCVLLVYSKSGVPMIRGTG